MIYTRTGDKLETSTIGGQRVSKSAPLIDFYGEIDGLNAAMGFAASLIESQQITEQIEREQRHLFVVPLLVCDNDSSESIPKNHTDSLQEATETLENEIDSMTRQLPVVADFILPGGSVAASAVGMARTQCRKAERSMSALTPLYHIDQACAAYINRLSDWLFVVSRFLNKISKVEEKKLH